MNWLIDNVKSYNVVWDTQSKNSSESMPVGGGDIGLNVWVENDDVLIYMGRSGAFDENNQLLKLGRIRIKLSPNPFHESVFRQTLHLRESCVEIAVKKTDGSKGSNESNSIELDPQYSPPHCLCRILVWVEVFSPVIHVNIQNQLALSVDVRYESWRREDRELPNLSKKSRFS